ncbi:MAG: response regulator [Planctomycetaceae bacterium]|nr:response regulator [Planctomycetaceae bacterium]
MSLRALICAAQPHISHALTLHLLRADVEVWTAGDSEHALDRLQMLHPDVVLVDLDMPGMTGWDVVAAANARIVALTTRTAEAVTQESRARGLEVDEILSAPFSPSALRSRIMAWDSESTKLVADRS